MSDNWWSGALEPSEDEPKGPSDMDGEAVIDGSIARPASTPAEPSVPIESEPVPTASTPGNPAASEVLSSPTAPVPDPATAMPTTVALPGPESVAPQPGPGGGGDGGSDGGAPIPSGSGRRSGLLAAALVAVLALVAVTVGVIVAAGGGDGEAVLVAAAEDLVVFEPKASPGEDPFTDVADTDANHRDEADERGDFDQDFSGEGTSLSVEVPGDTAGLYGGSLDDAVCDGEALGAFLAANPDRGAAWAAAQGIALADVESFIGSLTAVTLTADTRVTNHGFREGQATPFGAVLQAGTSVMVDPTGVPRVRCSCGNPLAAPTGDFDVDVVGGEKWPGAGERTIAEIAGADPQGAFTLVDFVDPTSGISRPVGGGGDSVVELPTEARVRAAGALGIELVAKGDLAFPNAQNRSGELPDDWTRQATGFGASLLLPVDGWSLPNTPAVFIEADPFAGATASFGEALNTNDVSSDATGGLVGAVQIETLDELIRYQAQGTFNHLTGGGHYEADFAYLGWLEVPGAARSLAVVERTPDGAKRGDCVYSETPDDGVVYVCGEVPIIHSVDFATPAPPPPPPTTTTTTTSAAALPSPPANGPVFLDGQKPFFPPPTADMCAVVRSAMEATQGFPDNGPDYQRLIFGFDSTGNFDLYDGSGDHFRLVQYRNGSSVFQADANFEFTSELHQYIGDSPGLDFRNGLTDCTYRP